MPGIADPGAIVVAAAHREGIRVVPLVGPSSILLALMASGMNGQQFAFHGYLPVPSDERAQALAQAGRGLARVAARRTSSSRRRIAMPR
jgi:16S rRNA (cytidine1402-2'-O)-methyltransferase